MVLPEACICSTSDIPLNWSLPQKKAKEEEEKNEEKEANETEKTEEAKEETKEEGKEETKEEGKEETKEETKEEEKKEEVKEEKKEEVKEEKKDEDEAMKVLPLLSIQNDIWSSQSLLAAITCPHESASSLSSGRWSPMAGPPEGGYRQPLCQAAPHMCRKPGTMAEVMRNDMRRVSVPQAAIET